MISLKQIIFISITFHFMTFANDISNYLPLDKKFCKVTAGNINLQGGYNFNNQSCYYATISNIKTMQPMKNAIDKCELATKFTWPIIHSEKEYDFVKKIAEKVKEITQDHAPLLCFGMDGLRFWEDDSTAWTFANFPNEKPTDHSLPLALDISSSSLTWAKNIDDCHTVFKLVVNPDCQTTFGERPGIDEPCAWSIEKKQCVRWLWRKKIDVPAMNVPKCNGTCPPEKVLINCTANDTNYQECIDKQEHSTDPTNPTEPTIRIIKNASTIRSTTQQGHSKFCKKYRKEMYGDPLNDFLCTVYSFIIIYCMGRVMALGAFIYDRYRNK